ncbi:MAG TPA: phage portal protein [Candidatus Pacearchaeota archaeon]|nr:phage portal protein [Candidatus Pacearchaeota archaeon]
MSDTESSKRQFYFFENNSVPNALFMLDPNITMDKDKLSQIKEDVNNKYKGSENAHKIMIAGGIQDVKILELSNKDLDLINLRNFIVKKW